ncbi:class II fructose-bisphosphate aldolase [bacterium]|nr:class II fructose-bisphosphate aldolase [bacterium]
MKFYSAKILVNDARDNNYAVPALNTNGGSYDIARAALEAAQELNTPLILQVYEPNCEYRGFDYYLNLAEFLCSELEITVPVAVQLDHGKSFTSVVKAMKAGFSSVMFDASNYPLDKNIEETREVVKVASVLGVSVEAEVGYVKGNEPEKEALIGRIPVPVLPSITPAKTRIDEALRFVKEVDIDMLAISVGTTHGVYEKQEGIDFKLLEKLRDSISIPLVQHGTCGISLDDISRLARGGMAKINFGEPFRFNYIKYFNELTDKMAHLWHPWKIMQECKNRLKQDMKKIICALGSEGKAANIISRRK